LGLDEGTEFVLPPETGLEQVIGFDVQVPFLRSAPVSQQVELPTLADFVPGVQEGGGVDRIRP